jgi:hypothetical protein
MVGGDAILYLSRARRERNEVGLREKTLSGRVKQCDFECELQRTRFA